MKTFHCKILFAYLAASLPCSLGAPANHRLFVLTGNQQILLFHTIRALRSWPEPTAAGTWHWRIQ